MTEEQTEVKTETISTPPKPKGRGPFYYIDGILVRLLLIVVVIALLWNWDGFWKTDIKVLDDFQKTYFPVKYEEERLKISSANEKVAFFDQLNKKIAKYEKEKDTAEKALAAVEKELAAVNKKATALLRHYDTSFRIIQQLKRKVSPDEYEQTIKCNSAECENIFKNKPDADPKKFSFE